MTSLFRSTSELRSIGCAVAPEPVSTPLITASFSAEKVARFGTDVPLGRPADPTVIAPCYVFLACEDSSYMTGQNVVIDGGRSIW